MDTADKNGIGYSVALFKGCNKPKRKPDYISRSGSRYWYGENKRGKWVIRSSTHWTERRELNHNQSAGDYLIPQCENIGLSYWAIKCKDPKQPVLTGKAYLNDIKKFETKDKQ